MPIRSPDSDAEDGATSCTLVVDQGTHASRALIFDARGECLHEAHREVRLLRQPQGIEQDARELLQSVRDVIDDVRQDCAQPITRIALATQRSTIVAWDRETGQPLAPAISWQDKRNERWLRQHPLPQQLLVPATGLRSSAHYGASKMRWWLDHEPAVKAAANDGRLLMGPLAGFLATRLLTDHPACVDTTNAARTLLCNINSGDWDEALLEHFGIRREWLPVIHPVQWDYGEVDGVGAPLVVLTGDQTAALFADGVPAADAAYVNLGSGAFVLTTTDGRRIEVPQLLAGIARNDATSHLYYVEGTVNGAGNALGWYEGEDGHPVDEALLHEALPATPNPPLFVNAVGGLGSPWWANANTRFAETPPDARSAVAGILESIVFLVTRNLESIRAYGLRISRLLLSGGLSRIDALCQRLADLNQLVTERVESVEATARGAAWLAQADASHWHTTPRTVFRPRNDTDLVTRYHRFNDVLSQSLLYE